MSTKSAISHLLKFIAFLAVFYIGYFWFIQNYVMPRSTSTLQSHEIVVAVAPAGTPKTNCKPKGAGRCRDKQGYEVLPQWELDNAAIAAQPFRPAFMRAPFVVGGIWLFGLVLVVGMIALWRGALILKSPMYAMPIIAWIDSMEERRKKAARAQP